MPPVIRNRHEYTLAMKHLAARRIFVAPPEPGSLKLRPQRRGFRHWFRYINSDQARSFLGQLRKLESIPSYTQMPRYARDKLALEVVERTMNTNRYSGRTVSVLTLAGLFVAIGGAVGLEAASTHTPLLVLTGLRPSPTSRVVGLRSGRV